ncbi:MAG TPA: AraC family transcriptional regulator [Caulobacteraceae bacterium]
MRTDALEQLLGTLDVNLEGFAVCEVQHGWRLNVSALDSVLIHYVLKGEGTLVTEGAETPLAPGMIVIAPAGIAKAICCGPTRIQVDAVERCAPLAEGMVAFRAGEGNADLVLACGVVSATYGGGFHRLFANLPLPLVEEVRGNAAFLAAFETMLEELSAPRLGARVVAEALMKQCLVLLLRDQIQRLGDNSPLFEPVMDPRLARAVADIMARPAAPHSLESLAQTAGMSRSAFAARFLDRYGATPFKFVQNVRLRTAARLLQTTQLPVKSIAAAAGYASRSHLSRSFRAAYGVDPSAFRAARMPLEPIGGLV